MPRPKLTPEIAYNLAKLLYRASSERDARLELTLARNPVWAYFYAKFVLAQDSTHARLYKRLLRTPEDHARFDEIQRWHAQS